MNWSDEGIVLGAKAHGETALVVQLLTREHGRHAGLVQGGQSSRARALYQPGNRVTAAWSARLADHLGSFRCELVESHGARLLDAGDRLTALSAAAAVLNAVLPEREPHPACFEGFLALLGALEGPHWGEVMTGWELALLAELGFGLDLNRCAAGGDATQLIYVSPKSGRAVSREAGEPYKDRLLPLPGFLVGRGGGGPEEVAQGLRLTGHFLAKYLFHPHDKDLPPARIRLAERLRVS